MSRANTKAQGLKAGLKYSYPWLDLFGLAKEHLYPSSLKGAFMVQSRRMLVSLLLAALLAITASVVGAAPGPQAKSKATGPKAKARMTWSFKRVEQLLNAGESGTATVTLTSNVDVANVSLRVPGGLGRIIKVSAAGVAQGSTFKLKANTPITVTLVFTVPAKAVESQAGVVQVLVGGRNTPASLKVFVKLTGTADADANAEQSKQPENKAGGQGNGRGKGNGKNKGK